MYSYEVLKNKYEDLKQINRVLHNLRIKEQKTNDKKIKELKEEIEYKDKKIKDLEITIGNLLTKGDDK